MRWCANAPANSWYLAVTDARCSDADVIDVDADRDQSNTAVSDMVALCCDGSRHQ